MRTRLEIAGQTFGRWKVLATSKRIGTNWCWLCRCECGTQRMVAATRLKAGVTLSCGCLNLEVLRNRKGRKNPAYSHGLKGTPFLAIWSAMLSRCTNPKNRSYANYGGRGITVCAEWFDGAAFGRWARRGWKKGLTLDRKDNDKGYSPANCRWVDRGTQNNNRSNNRWVMYEGRKMTMAQAARLAGLPLNTPWGRKRLGWPESRWFEKARTRNVK